MKKILFLLAVSVTGCATTTGIVQINNNTYMLGKSDGMAWSGSTIKAELYKEANEFCKSKGKQVAPLDSKAEDYRYASSSANAEIQFRCQ